MWAMFQECSRASLAVFWYRLWKQLYKREMFMDSRCVQAWMNRDWSAILLDHHRSVVISNHNRYQNIAIYHDILVSWYIMIYPMLAIFGHKNCTSLGVLTFGLASARAIKAPFLVSVWTSQDRDYQLTVKYANSSEKAQIAQTWQRDARRIPGAAVWTKIWLLLKMAVVSMAYFLNGLMMVNHG